MSWHRPFSGGLLLQFAAASFVVVVCMGVALGWMLGRIVEQNALTDASMAARDVVSRRVMDHLSPGDLRSPMTGERYDAFQRLVQESVVSGRTARIKLWSRDGTVIFSDDAALVGQRFPIGYDLGVALEGELAMDVSNLQGGDHLADRQFGRLLEVYVPIVFPGSAEVEGAFEVYQFYEPVARYVQDSLRSLYIALAAGLLFIYGALVAVVKRGHDTITRQQKRLGMLNRIATELSRCRTSSEVLSTGLRLAAEATGLVKGAIWLVGPGDRVELAARRGFGEEDTAFLSGAPVDSGALRQVLSEGQTHVPDRLQMRARYRLPGRENHAPALAAAAPLLSRGSVLGALGLYAGADGESTKPDIQLAQAVGAELGVTLENARRYEEARYQADRDPVTGLLNHRAFHDCLDREFKRARRAGRRLSVVMMDLDGFKLFNDTYGHPAGDLVLREVTALLSQSLRAGDLLGRYGGDEFVALLPETGTEGAEALAERIRQAIAGHAFVPPDGPAVPLRLSLGFASYPQDARHGHELLGFADANLYTSKRRGGNTVTGCNSVLEDGVVFAGSFGVLDGLIEAVDNKDHYTRQHSEDVTGYAVSIAQALGLSDESQRTLRLAGLLHDVGKIGVPDRILRKPGRLDEEETGIIRQHAALGEIIIKDVPNVGELVAAVGAHHERFDGLGYPQGRRGEDIPLLGRILAVADAYSAMTMDRPYRKALRPAEARRELLRAAGTQLDPQLVQLFLDQLPEDAPATDVPATAVDHPAGTLSAPERLVEIS